jgi:intracellular sulfur oxidation DsrE/DsrF family protein
MKLIKLLVFTLLIQLSTNAFAQTNNQPKQHKVVIQLNTADTAAWGGVIGNVKNLSKIWPGNISIEVVVHGKALNFLVASKSHLITDIEDLLKQGIAFNACENTMKKYGITKQMLIPAVVSVPSGVAELILKQEEGWSYLKAGL